MNPLQRMYLNKIGAGQIVQLADDINQGAANRPDVQAAGDKFGDYAEKNTGQLKALEAQLEKNPQLAGQIKTLVTRDPAAFEKILPDMFANPDRTGALVQMASAPAAAPAAAPVSRPQAATPPAPAVGAPAAASPSPVAAAAPGPAIPGTAAPSANPAPAGAAIAADQAFSRKFDQLKAAPGFVDFMKLAGVGINGPLTEAEQKKVNPAIADLVKRFIDSPGTPGQKEQGLDQILDQVKRNPRFFTNLTRTIDEKPGVVSSIASSAANVRDPVGVFTTLGTYSEFSQSDFMKTGFGRGFGGILDGLMKVDGLGQMIMAMVSMVSSLFGGNKNFLIGASNNGMDMFSRAVAATGAQPETVQTVTPGGDVVDAKQQAAATANTGPQKPQTMATPGQA